MLISAFITLFSGVIAKFLVKADSCDQTKLLLFVTGIILGLFFIGLGSLYYNFDNENKLGKLYTEWKDWSNKEQYGIHKKV